MDDSSKDGFQATPASTLEQQIMDACVPKNEREHWAAREITRLRAEVKRLTAAVNAANSQAEHFERQWYLRGDEVEALRGITPELPPRPPDGGGLPRYGLRHNGSAMPMSVPMADGYWTPYHLAIAEVEALRAAAREVCEWADAAQWALGNETGVPAAKLDALRAAIGVEAAQGGKHG